MIPYSLEVSFNMSKEKKLKTLSKKINFLKPVVGAWVTLYFKISVTIDIQGLDKEKVKVIKTFISLLCVSGLMFGDRRRSRRKMLL